MGYPIIKLLVMALFSIMFCFFSVPSASATTVSYTGNEIILGQAGQPMTVTMQYTNPSGWINMKEVGFWIDTQTPRGYRLNYSLHGKLKNVGGTFKLYGERYGGAEAQSPLASCGNDPVIRHCYKNYSWDVGGFDPGGSAIYMNHTGTIADTVSATSNTIGKVSVQSIRGIDTTTLEVVWVVTPYTYFVDAAMDLYTFGTNESGGSIFGTTAPAFRVLKKVRIFDTDTGRYDLANLSQDRLTVGCNTETDRVKFVSGGTTNSLTLDTAEKYLGAASCKASLNTYAQYDFGTNTTGVVTLFFHDDMASGNAFYVSVSNADVAAAADSSTHTIIVGYQSSVNATNYIYKARMETIDTAVNVSTGENERYLNTNIPRSAGWHKVIFWVTPEGAWAEMDDPSRTMAAVNLSSLTYQSYPDKNRLTSPFDYDMRSFRYIRIGTWAATGNVRFDEVGMTGLPVMPVKAPLTDLTTYDGAMHMQNYFSAIWLDNYEDLALFNEYRNLPSKTTDTPVIYWWYDSLQELATALAIRYKVTGLPVYKEETGALVDFVLQNKATVYSNNFNGPSAMGEFASFIWPMLSVSQQQQVRDSITTESTTLTDANCSGYVGNSVAEDCYAYGPLSGSLNAALFFGDDSRATQWAKTAIANAKKALSTDRNAACAECTGGKIGVQSIYAPGQVMSDCSSSNPSSIDCLCPGDRALLPANRVFSYLLDNHDFSPHPGYMSSVIDPIVTAAYMTSIIRGISPGAVPSILPTSVTGFNPIIKQVWDRWQTFYDYTRNRYVATDIWRVRYNRGSSDNGCSISPYNQTTDNSFRTMGIDDWGGLPNGIVMNANLMLKDKIVFGVSSFVDGKGVTQSYDSQISRKALLNFWMFNDYIARPEVPNMYFTAADIINAGTNPTAYPKYPTMRANMLHSKLYRVGLIDPSLRFPLVPGGGPTATPAVTRTPTLRPSPSRTPSVTATIPPRPSGTVTPTPTPTGKPGDANDDHRVDGYDYVIWLNHYGGTPLNGYKDGDFNSDNRVDGYDYVIWLNHYGM